jgi:hypothetical protein
MMLKSIILGISMISIIVTTANVFFGKASDTSRSQSPQTVPSDRGGF